MSKRLMMLGVLFILLVSVLVSYGYYQETSSKSTSQNGSSNAVNPATLNSEINASLLDESQGVEIGDMV
ncbi:MAG TPA: hypothetical protein VMT57_00100 [Candidatus Thermoplasmatota archaeon]|nr:hypothetical protein [Candidatus Thermoplasmatota archaeon]